MEQPTNGQKIIPTGAKPQFCGDQNQVGGEELEKIRGNFGGLASERIFHSKALRFVCAQWSEVDVWAVEYLAMLRAYILLVDRENVGVEETAAIDWSGARSNWKRRMKEGARQAAAAGAIEYFEVGGLKHSGKPGRVVDLTDKGRRMLEAYGRRFEELIEEHERRRVVAVLNGEARRLRLLERRRRAEEMKRGTAAG